MAVTSHDPHDPPRRALPPRADTRPPRKGGLVSGRAMGRVLHVLVPLGALTLILLSMVGTFYGSRNLEAPLNPLLWVRDMWGARSLALLAFIGQGTMLVAQWGGRHNAKTDPRWWVLYFLSLGLSVWWNWAAFGAPLVAAGLPWLIALGLVVGGDVAPELTLVRDD